MNLFSQNTVSVAAAVDLIEEIISIDSNTLDYESNKRLSKILSLDLKSRITESDFLHIWHTIDTFHPMPEIGLVLGKKIIPSSKGLLASWVSQANYIEEALDIFIKNICLMNSSEHWTKTISGTTCTIALNLDHNKSYPIKAIERSMSAMVSWANVLSGKDFPLIHATFNFSKPSYIQMYKSIFGENLHFSSDYNTLVFPSKYLQIPIITSSLLLKKVAEKEAKQAINKLQEPLTNSARVRALIVKQLDTGQLPLVDNVSQYMHISRQTLHRRLQAEGTSYKVIVDSIRKEKVKHSLDNGECSITELSYQLGFKDTSSFYKAFKRWFGVSPISYSSL